MLNDGFEMITSVKHEEASNENFFKKVGAWFGRELDRQVKRNGPVKVADREMPLSEIIEGIKALPDDWTKEITLTPEQITRVRVYDPTIMVKDLDNVLRASTAILNKYDGVAYKRALWYRMVEKEVEKKYNAGEDHQVIWQWISDQAKNSPKTVLDSWSESPIRTYLGESKVIKGEEGFFDKSGLIRKKFTSQLTFIVDKPTLLKMVALQESSNVVEEKISKSFEKTLVLTGGDDAPFRGLDGPTVDMRHVIYEAHGAADVDGFHNYLENLWFITPSVSDLFKLI